ncbi:protein FAM83H [Embiotoca jacksoni]|uniref:protein FAM83H n=1 Tax=Embiotoca jacksoni TaxID=100190 RepID=UPI0037044A7B
MARRSQCSSAGDNPLDPNYLPPHYREEYRLAIDTLVEEDLEGYYQFLQKADVVDFLSSSEIQHIQSCVQVPHHSSHPEQRFVETGGDGSSDTYWPVHSDLDVPGLDLGWPQLHHFIGPTEVTTLVNPPEPDMPSIKEQARRLVKNAQQVIAIVMDMFTDVDMFADILNAASRNVAVYIILDEQNVHHFINMVSSCRVNLQSIQFLRVRTVSGITYKCRSGKSFKGQMMDRFLLTDCRAVLSGNYSFMWSFEKLHRCMAHLFLGQLVSTFDEEFRILFAQSQPLLIENVPAPMDDLSLLQKRQYPSDRTSLYRDTKMFLSLDTGHPDEWPRQSYDDRMEGDWRMTQLKRQESLRGPPEIYSRLPSQQSRLDPPFDQGPARIPALENPAFQRHSYAEGGHGRHPYQFLQQQGMPDSESQGRPFPRGQQPYSESGPETDHSVYDKFWNQGYYVADEYSEPAVPLEMHPPDNFDPVLNYLSSTRNIDFDQSSEKLPPAADLPFSSSHLRRLSLGQPYVCQTSPTPSNTADQKQFFPEQSADRKDPIVKRGLRNWRINSYLSAYDNPGDEGLPLGPPEGPDPFEEASNPIQQTAPGVDLSGPKIPNVREFKVPAIPRPSQMPSYAKIAVREQPKKVLDEPAAVAAETKIPSESSSTTEGEKTEEAEQKEPKPAGLRREDSFRRKYNAAVPRSSRLRSSLIFSSLDQQHQHAPQDTKTTTADPQDEESDKNEAEQTKPFVSHVWAQRKSAVREPFEWGRYIKSATFDKSSTETSKAVDDDSSKEDISKDLSENPEAQESLKLTDVAQATVSPSMPPSKPSEAESGKTDQPVQPPKPLLTDPAYVDMSDPDNRLMFFKQLAANRKATKAAEAENSKEMAQTKPTADLKNNAAVKRETEPKETSENTAVKSEGLSEKQAAAEKKTTVLTEACESLSLSGKTDKQDSVVKNDSNTSQSCKEEETKVSADSEQKSQSALILPVSADTPQNKSTEPNLSSPALKESNSSHPPAPTNATPANVSSLAQGGDKSKSLDLTSNESKSVTPCSVEPPSSSVLESNTQNSKSVQSESSVSSPSLPPEQDTGSEINASNPAVQDSSSDHTRRTSLSSSSAPPPTPGATTSSNITPEDSTSPSLSSILSPNIDTIEAKKSISSSPQESSQSAEETLQKSVNPSDQNLLDPGSQMTSSETASAVDSVRVESDISPETCAAGSQPKTSSSQTTTKTSFEELSAATLLTKEPQDVSAPEKGVSKSEICSLPKNVAEVPASSKDIKADNTSPNFSPSAPESGSHCVSGLESSASKCDLKETVTQISTQVDAPPEHSPSGTSSPVNTDFIPSASPSETSVPLEDAPVQATLPSDLNLKGLDAHTPADTILCASPSESVESVLSPEAKQAETNMSASLGFSDPNSLSSENLSTKSPSSPTEPTSKVPAEVDLPGRTTESVTSECHISEPSTPAENSQTEPELPDTGEKNSDDTEDTNEIHKNSTQESVSSEKTNNQLRQSNGSETAEITSKQPKSSQSRYHSSTANVLSSSNLRDDTKLLLEQISANSQNRNEATKESPVTDDEKEDEADKNAKREKDGGIRMFNRGQPKSTEERDKLLTRIQSMRKDRKVYSRFDV